MGLRKARNLQRKATADMASVAMNPRVSHVARVHHYGLRDKVDRRDRNSPVVKYASCLATRSRKSRTSRTSCSRMQPEAPAFKSVSTH